MSFFDRFFGKKQNAGPTGTHYEQKLLAAKQFYPFARWQENYSNGLTQYTKENCNKIKKVFDDLIASLIALGEHASEEQKKQLFKTAILATNQLNEA